MAPAFFLAAQVVCGGLVRDFTYDAPDRTPLYFGGECRAEGVAAKDCCVFADVYYADGTALCEEANAALTKMLKEETAATLDRVLFTASNLMKNAFSRSDA